MIRAVVHEHRSGDVNGNGIVFDQSRGDYALSS